MFSKYVIFLLSPLGTSLCLLGGAIFLTWRRRWQGSISLATLAFIWLWVWSMPVASTWLREAIEYKYPPRPVSEYPKEAALVVLGGAMSPPTGRNIDIDLGAAADRGWHAARLFQAGKAPLVVLSGGADSQFRCSEARAMAIFLENLGVPPASMLLEEDSRNTRENAVFSARLLKKRGIGRILLVTSALHMPRALALFSEQGLQVVPAPTDFESDQQPPGLLAWLPDALALEGSGRAFKELVGLRTGC